VVNVRELGGNHVAGTDSTVEFGILGVMVGAIPSGGDDSIVVMLNLP